MGCLLITGMVVVAWNAEIITCIKCLTHQHRGHGYWPSMERNASTSLKTLASAESDFRANDRDGDDVNQFWRRDVAGLYALTPAGQPPIKIIELSVAAADDRPVIDLSPYAARSSKSGYWYRAIRHAEEDPKALDPNRFAFFAFPDPSSAAKHCFVIDENSTIFRAVAEGRRGIDVYPTKEELKKDWEPLN